MFNIDASSKLQLHASALHAQSKINVSAGNNQVEIRDGVSGVLVINIKGKNNRVVIDSNVRVFGALEIACMRSNSEIVVGADCTFQGKVRLFTHETSRITIGPDCMFSGDILVTTSDMHAIFDDSGLRINKPAPIEIGSHVWIGSDVRVLKGVRIGKGSVVGMASVVVGGEYPEACIIAGVPGKVIRNKIKWTRTIPENE